MTPRTLANLFAAGRVAFGAGMLLAPPRVARGWIGDDAERPPVTVLIRAVGARDVIIGAGALLALAGGQSVRPWLRAGVAADLADAGITIASLRLLPREGAIVTMALTAGAALAGARLASAVE